jgi:cytochrome c oxidase cbb3-type subunit 1
MFFLSGMLMMFFNVVMTVRQAKRESAAIEAKLSAKMSKAGLAGA